MVPTAPATDPEDAGDWMERFFEGSQPIPVTPAEPGTTTPETDLEGGTTPSTTRKDATQG